MSAGLWTSWTSVGSWMNRPFRREPVKVGLGGLIPGGSVVLQESTNFPDRPVWLNA
jgi:hypothetical protein